MSEMEKQTHSPGPFTLLFSIYNARLALDIKVFSMLSIEKQCGLLQSEYIQNKASRQKLMNTLIETEKAYNLCELSSKSFVRIRIKHILSQFFKESNFLKSSKNVQTWSSKQLILSFVIHLINESKKDKAKVWESVQCFCKYFEDISFDGSKFINSFDANPEKGTKGFGIQVTKEICAKYEVKAGRFAKVKKHCTAWAARLYLQSSEDDNISSKMINAKEVPHNYNKFMTDVSMLFGNEHVQQNDALNGKKWYWYNDMNGLLQWIPYKEVDCKKLSAAWMNNENMCLIVDGGYRVVFDRSNSSHPSGNQYNNRQQNPGGRTVVCSVPKKQIHGVDVSESPL